jgi:hypothetical protein
MKPKCKQPATPADGFNVRDPKNWRFDSGDVPDSELVSCCFWEYARESAFIRDTVAKHRALVGKYGYGNPVPATSEVKEVSRAMNAIQVSDKPTPHILGNSLSHVFGEDDSSNCFPTAWQLLTTEERARIANMANEKSSAFLVETGPVILSALARQAESDLPDGARPSLNWYDGETLTLRIAWRYYRNEELAAKFQKWALKNRPAQYPELPPKGGHKSIDWRMKLRDLGVMRLLNKFTVGVLPLPAPQGYPEAARYFARWKEHSQWSAARKRALNHFRELLPFLAPRELPIHAPTKGGKGKLYQAHTIRLQDSIR